MCIYNHLPKGVLAVFGESLALYNKTPKDARPILYLVNAHIMLYPCLKLNIVS
jgi:hypothetical protein